MVGGDCLRLPDEPRTTAVTGLRCCPHRNASPPNVVMDEILSWSCPTAWSGRTPVLVALAVALLSVELHAQEPRDSARADSSRQLERVVVRAARVPATAGGAGAIIVQPDSLRSFAAPLLADALRETPFVLVRQNSRGEMELSVRGSDSRQMAVLVDGIPITLGWDHRADPSLVPLSGVEHLVLVRGLASLLHGPNVLGGVVEAGIAGRDAPELARRRSWAAGSVDQDGGSTVSLGASAPVTLGSGELGIRAGGAYRHRNGFRVPAAVHDTTARDGLRTNSDVEHVDGFASVRWQGHTGRYAGLTTTGFRAERGVPPELHVLAPRLWRYPSQSRVLAALTAGSGLLTTPLGGATIDLAGGFQAGRQAIESFTDRTYSTIDARERGDERTVTGRLTARHSLPRAGEVRAAVTVADVRYRETLGDAAVNDYRQQLWSTGAEAEWQVATRATMSGGVVYDAASTPETGGREAQEPMHAVGWRGGATVRAAEAVRLHASVSRRARFPALRELYSGALDRFQPNPALRPETLTGMELGVTFGAAGAGTGTSLQAVGFHHQLRDAVVRTTVPETRRYLRVNRDEIRSTGVELFGQWRSAADAAQAVMVTGDLLAQAVRVHDALARAERHAEHQPETRGTLELGVPLVAGVRGTAAMRYTGAQYCVHPDTGDERRLAPGTDGSLALDRSWPVRVWGGILRTVLAFDNVTDAAVFDQCGLPQPGRTLRLVVRIG